MPESDITILPLATDVFKRLQKRYDETYGGFGKAPKFPSPSQTTQFLSRFASYHLMKPNCSKEEKADSIAAVDMAVQTMVKIYNGGIRDVVGGGFSRYSVDERWHVPHCKFVRVLARAVLIGNPSLSREDAVSV